ncbi:cyclic nucleotide-binding domain-containing protein [bacterium]|nr:cyclic nucleotide-binding domain-containing protein [bacterium]
MVDLRSLSAADMLAGLTDADLQKLGAIAEERQTAPGEQLLKRGDTAESLYLIRDGRFALTIAIVAAGHQTEVPIEEKGRGDMLGWSALVEPRTSIYTAVCTLPGSVIVIPRDAFLVLAASDAGLGYRFMINLCRLIKSRASTLQALWIEEVEQSMSRVKYWLNRGPRSDSAAGRNG